MAKEKPTFIPEDIGLLEFKILRGLIESPPAFDLEEIESFQFDMGYEMGLNLDDNLVQAEIEFSVESESSDENEAEASGFFRFCFTYQVNKLKKLAKVSKGKVHEVSSDLAIAIASMTYSTSRGILLTRFQGTDLEDFILPVVNPAALLEIEGTVPQKKI